MTTKESSTERLNFKSGTPWEPLRGYSRAVRVGDTLHVSGTTAISPEGEVIGPGDAYIQTKYILDFLRQVLATAGFKIADVVRTRLFVTNMNKWDEYARAHSEVFDTIRPASSIIQVTRLVDPRLVVEIEADAVINCSLIDTVTVARSGII